MNRADIQSAPAYTVPVDVTRARRRKRALNTTGRVVFQIAVTILSLAFALPFIWMVSTSLKTDPQVYHIPPIWIPLPPRWQNYTEGLTYVSFGTYFLNTLQYCLFTTVGIVLSCSVVAYGFSKLQWKGRDTLFFVLLATMMIPFQVQMIPLYLIFKNWGWLDTYLPLVVPSFFGSAYYIFMLRQFFLTIPNELSDAARIDGAGDVQTLWHVVLPLAKPAIAVVGLFQFMDAWNDYLGPLIYLRDSSRFPIALGLEQMRAHSMSVNIPLLWPHLMAASAVTILPIVLLYFFTQRTFVEGITVTGIKG